jgi:hypothetical protein
MPVAPPIWEAEAGESPVLGPLGQYREHKKNAKSNWGKKENLHDNS